MTPDRLLRAIRREPPGEAPSLRLRWGAVTAVGTGMVTVDIGSTPVQMKHLKSYSPTVGDHVAVLANGTDYVAIGDV